MKVDSELFDFAYRIAATFSLWMRPTISFFYLFLSYSGRMSSNEGIFCRSLMSYDNEVRVFCSS